LAEDTGQERTERATERRREETRQKGQVARSIELNSAIMLFAGFFILFFFGKYILTHLTALITDMFSLTPVFEVDTGTITNIFLDMMLRYFTVLLPVFVILIVVGILVNILQVGFIVTGEPLRPKLNKINPFEGAKRLFSQKSAETLLRDVLKIIVVGWIGYTAMTGALDTIMGMAGATAREIIAYTGSAVFSISMKILIGYLVLAILDYGYQRWDYERSIMMTRQELREELKQLEGDPLMRARVRAVQREMARRRMMEEVPEAEVVITNPTEIAVALTYEPGMTAPVVVAKGMRLIAERIRALAVEAGVPIVENVMLAQALYKSVDIGRPIPEDLYTAVAEVLAYVYQLRGKKVV